MPRQQGLAPPHALQLLREPNAPLRQKNERFKEYASVIKEKTSSKPNPVSTGHARKEAHRAPGSAQAAVCITSPVRAEKKTGTQATCPLIDLPAPGCAAPWWPRSINEDTQTPALRCNAIILVFKQCFCFCWVSPGSKRTYYYLPCHKG